MKIVLIVEDDKSLSKILIDEFQEEGFESKHIANGLDVEKGVKEFKPDIILLDLVLPGLDGFQVLKNLKEDDETKNIPVIVISNLNSAGDVRSAMILGANEYFVKSDIELKTIIQHTKKLIN